LGEHKMPTMGFGGAEDLTQRHRDPYQVRTSDSSAQCLYPLAAYAGKEMELKAAITAGDDFAFGYEQVGGFQSVFEGDGGRVIKTLWSLSNTTYYVPYLAQSAPKQAEAGPGGGGWRAWNGSPPGYTVQGGNGAPYQGPVGGPPRRWYGY